MSRQNHAIHLCSFSVGCFDIRSESGKQGISFDDSDRFGPSKVNMKTGDLSEIPAKHWFWRFYGPWREAGRPTEGEPVDTPNGPLLRAVWASTAAECPSVGTPEGVNQAAETTKTAVVPEGMMTLIDELEDKADELDMMDARGQVWGLEDVSDLMRRARSALANRDPQAGEWRPIETAPKDRTHFLALTKAGAVVAYRHNPSSRTDNILSVPGEWPQRATHWMPLPASPQDDRLANTKEWEG